MTSFEIFCWAATALLAPAFLGVIFGKGTNPLTGPQLMMQFGPEKGLDKWRGKYYRNDGRFAGLIVLIIPAIIYAIYVQF